MVETAGPPIVGIGASAGGVRALQALFHALPKDTGAAFVVVIHLDPEFHSELPAVLGNQTDMPVVQVQDTARLEPNQVYVIAPNQRLRIADHQISSHPFEEPRGQRAPIDMFFRSLAEQHGDGFAVILTGAGGDGAIGVKAIKEAGGIVLVQDPNEAEYSSMPRSAIAMEVADFVLPIKGIALQLADLLRQRDKIRSNGALDQNEENLRRILTHVRVRTGHDFSKYKRATVNRRIARRAQVTRRDSLEDYSNYLRDNAEEAQALFRDFLIGVTTFFRDPKAFDALAAHVIPALFKDKEAGSQIRVWVPGCATGEEVYTIGMLLLEEASRRDLRPEIQVFGSDLDMGALAIAREGRYPAAIEADVGEERLRRFFLKEGDHYRVRRELRDIILFATHSTLKDPPFSRLDLISCRNLMIYLDRDLQRLVCSTFHYALRPGGYLFLGSSEAADQPPGLFRVLDREARIYQVVGTGADKRIALPVLLNTRYAQEKHPPTPPRPALGGNVGDAAMHRQMLERIAPPSMLIDEGHRAVHLSEQAGRYLQPSGGPVSVDAADLVRQEFRFELRSALHRAFERGEATLSMPILVRFNGGLPHRVYLHVKPVPGESESVRYALVMFIEGEAVEWGTTADTAEPADHGQAGETIRQLQDELQAAQARLRATLEEAEATNEELRAANEELQSINEEYRSTSEELETSKEELQSINEELQTVNNELKLKLETVSRAHSDLQNLMAVTDVGTLFLDTSLRIKRFTPRLTELFNITANDEGRPITDFTHQLAYENLAERTRQVLKDLLPVDQEVQSHSGAWYLVRMRPYRTIDDKIDGIVVTFVDITERRRAEEALRSSEARLRQETRLVELSRAPIFVWDADDGILQWNRGSEELYGYARVEALGQRKDRLLQTVVPGSSFEELRRSLVENGMWSGEVLHRTKDGRVLTVETQIEMVSFEGRRLVLESTRDVTAQRRWVERQRLLLDELSHRVKNTLTVVQSMVRHTLRRSTTLEEFAEGIEGRISALANAHKLLVQSNWEGTELEALAHGQLDAYGAKDRQRIAIEGSPIRLPPSLATSFSLILHELATNAEKHGALSSENGKVSLRWDLLGNDSRQLRVVWQEHDGPPVSPPDQKGFGSELIQRGLPGAVVDHAYLPDGVECTIDLELPESHSHEERI
jgi:two-component system CheB/CheR fusion protein